MEKIKNILSGKHKHDEKTHQSGHNTSTATPSTAPTAGTVSGQGSHFGGETRTGMTGVTGSQVSSHMPGEFPADASAAGYSTAATQPGDGQEPPTTAGLHSSSKASRADPRVDPDLDNSQTVGKAGAYSNTQGTGYDSGVGSTGGSSTTASPQLSNVANKSNPRDDSDLDGSRTADNFGTSVTNTGSAAVGSTTAPRGFPLGSSAGSTNAGPRPSNMPNQADPRVDPDRDGPRAAGNTAGTAAIGGTTTARSFPLGGTSSSTSSGLHSSDLANKADPRVDSDNSRLTGISESTMGRSHPLHSGSGNTSVTSTGSGTSTTGHTLTTTGSGHHLGRDAAAVGTAAAAGEGVHHRNKQSSLGSTTEPSGIASSSLHTASGPHETDTANRLGPHVAGSVGREDAIHHHERHGGGDEEADGSHKKIGTTSADAMRIGDTNLTDRTTVGSSHTGRNAALGAGAGATAGGLAAHEYNSRHGDQTSGQGNTSGTTGTGLSSGATSGNTYPGDQTSGLGNTSGATGASLSSGTPRDPAGNTYGRDTTTTSTSGHHGRDAALGTAAGAGAAGLVKHEYDNHSSGQASGLGSTSSTSHSSGQPTTTGDYSSTGNNHVTAAGSSHHGRDAALGAGAAGFAKHEYDNHHAGQTSGLGNTSTAGHSTTQPTTGDYSNTSSSYCGGDVALGTGGGAGVAGAAGYAMHEHDKNLIDPTTAGTTTTSSTTESKHHGRHKNHKDHGHHDRDHDRNATAGSSTTHHDRESQMVEEKRRGSGSHVHDKLGEHLHGQRQTGAVGSSGFPDQPGFGDDRVSGPHETTGGATTGAHYDQSTSSAVRAGGPGEYEHDPSRSGNYSSGSGHLGAGDASSAPGKPSEGAFGQDGKPIAGHGIPAAYGLGEKTATSSDGHTRLHKDPPAGHPASQAAHQHGSGKGLERDPGVGVSGGGHSSSPNSSIGRSVMGNEYRSEQ